MVYCSKCGTKNIDTDAYCSNCGAPLNTVGQRYPGSDREHYRRMENECFGLPNGGMIVGIVVGLFIVLLGLGLFLQGYGINIDFWPFMIIIIGALFLVGALYRYRRYNQGSARPN